MSLNDDIKAWRSFLQQERQIIFLPLMGGSLGARREPERSLSTPRGGAPPWSARYICSYSASVCRSVSRNCSGVESLVDGNASRSSSGASVIERSSKSSELRYSDRLLFSGWGLAGSASGKTLSLGIDLAGIKFSPLISGRYELTPGYSCIEETSPSFTGFKEQ